MFDIYMWSMRIALPKACHCYLFVARFQKVSYDSDYFYSFVDYDFRVTFFLSVFDSQGAHTSGFSVCTFKI